MSKIGVVEVCEEMQKIVWPLRAQLFAHLVSSGKVGMVQITSALCAGEAYQISICTEYSEEYMNTLCIMIDLNQPPHSQIAIVNWDLEIPFLDKNTSRMFSIENGKDFIFSTIVPTLFPKK